MLKTSPLTRGILLIKMQIIATRPFVFFVESDYSYYYTRHFFNCNSFGTELKKCVSVNFGHEKIQFYLYKINNKIYINAQ